MRIVPNIDLYQADCGSAADVVASFSGTNLCRATPGARSLQQVATMSGCAINIFSDGACLSVRARAFAPEMRRLTRTHSELHAGGFRGPREPGRGVPHVSLPLAAFVLC